MRTTLLILLLLLVPTSLAAEDEPSTPSFPASWHGNWTGPSAVVRGGETVMEFPMELHVAPLESGAGHKWQIVYGEDERRQVRPYELLPVDAGRGHYRIDEKNSIEIDAYFENERLRSRFWVADNVIEATYERDGDAMTVTLTTFGAKPLRMTGGRDKVPAVGSYALKSVQRATLTRAR